MSNAFQHPLSNDDGIVPRHDDVNMNRSGLLFVSLSRTFIKMSDEQNAIIDEGDYYTDVNGYQVPQNIRHRFRSTITSELLGNREKVDQDRRDLEYVAPRQRTPIYRRSQSVSLPSDPDYTKISNDLRSTVCRGHPVERRSHSKTIHNEQVFQGRRGSGDEAHSYRRKKDWLGRWTEANIIRDRLFKNIAGAQKKSTS